MSEENGCEYEGYIFSPFARMKCPRGRHEGSKFCVFHASTNEKTAGDFNGAFLKHLNANLDDYGSSDSDEYRKMFVFNCEGFIFPEGTQLPVMNYAFAVNLTDAHFEGPLVLFGLTFNGEMWFLRSRFDEGVHLNEVSFEDNAIFREATFNGNSRFINVVIKKTLDFSKANFLKGETTFRGLVKEPLVGINNEFITDGRNILIPKEPAPEIDFTNVKIGSESYLCFNESDLGRCALGYTQGIENPEKVRFVNVDWFGGTVKRNKKTGDDRSFLEIKRNYGLITKAIKTAIEGFHEYQTFIVNLTPEELEEVKYFALKTIRVFPEGDIDKTIRENRITLKNQIKNARKAALLNAYREILEVFRRLRRNYETRLSYAEAGDFHVGEMRMLRKLFWRRKKFVSWGFSILYNLISRYGESIWLPLAWLGGLFAITALSYWLSGQTTGEALRSSFLGFVSLKIKLYEGVTGWLVPSLQRIIVIPLITHFILSLRRAFRL